MKNTISSIKEKRLNYNGNLAKNVWKYKYMYLFLLPAVLWHFIFKYIPMYGILLAFKDYRFDRGILGSPWVGFQYFKNFFGYFEFWTLIFNTLKISAMKLFIGFPIPIIFALMLNEVKNRQFKKVIQTVSYLPHFVSWAVVLALFTKLFSPNDGIVNELMLRLCGREPINYLGETKYFYNIIMGTYLWKEVGWGSIIFLAAITGVDVQLYEASRIDGANKLQNIWYITLPCIIPTMCIVFLLNVSSLVSAGFDQLYLFQTPSTLQVSEVLDTYIIKTGLKQGMFSYGTAIGFFLSVISLILVLITNAMAKKFGGQSLW